MGAQSPVWGAVCAEGTPHGLGSVWSRSSRSCTPRLTSPSSLHPTHHMVQAPMMGPSSFHLLRTNFPPPPHQPLSILILSPLFLRQLGPRFLQEAFLDLPGYMRLQFLHLNSSLFSGTLCTSVSPSRWELLQGGSWGLFTSVSPILSMASWTHGQHSVAVRPPTSLRAWQTCHHPGSATARMCLWACLTKGTLGAPVSRGEWGLTPNGRLQKTRHTVGTW